MDISDDESASEKSSSELLDHDTEYPLSPEDNFSSTGRKVTPLFILTVFSAVFGSSTQFGFNLGVLNNIESVVRSSLRDPGSFVVSSSFSELEWATAAAIFAVGGMIGSIPAGIVADLIGRKWAMIYNNAIAVAAVCLQSAAIHPFMLIAGRLLIGVNAGANTVLAPLYISEISPVRYRGTMGVFHQLAITICILVSQLLGLEQVVGRSEDYGWRILLAVPLVFVTVQLLTLPFCPESPKFLYIKKQKEAKAKKALRRLNGCERYQAELDALQEEASQTVSSSFLVTLKEFVIKPSLRRAILVSIALHLSQQITGIGSILLYSTDTFNDSGIDNGDIATAVVGLTLLIGTIVTIVLIDRVGRRTLMLYGLGGMFIFYGVVSTALCYQYSFYDESTQYSPTGILLVLATLCITFSFAIGPGAIPWLLVGELFQQAARPTAVSIATITNWSSNFAVSFAFPFMLEYLEPYPFTVFIVVSGIFWLIIYLYLPETKNKTVDEITLYFQKVTSDSSSPSCIGTGSRFSCCNDDTPPSSPVIIN